MTPAERQRRYRERKRLGLSVHRIYLDRWQQRQLIDAGLIEPDALEDQDAFADQLGDALEILLSRHGSSA